MNTTEQNNILLAEFLGERAYKLQAYRVDIKTISEYIKNPCFQNSWEWLMPVVDKIESLNFTFEIKKNWAKISKNKQVIVVRWEEDNSKIEATYNAAVEFINWYNKNLTSQTKNETSCK